MTSITHYLHVQSIGKLPWVISTLVCTQHITNQPLNPYQNKHTHHSVQLVKNIVCLLNINKQQKRLAAKLK